MAVRQGDINEIYKWEELMVVGGELTPAVAGGGFHSHAGKDGCAPVGGTHM